MPDPSGKIETGVIYEAPRNETEEILLDIWMKVLRVKRAGINDDFFSLGGDSIKVLQLVSRLKSAGFDLDVEKVYNHPTIKELAKVFVSKNKHSQETVTGKVNLTPIQLSYLDGEFKQDSLSQSVVLFKEDGIQPDLIKKVFGNVMVHHDALRMVYKSYGEKILQINRGHEGNLYDLHVYNDSSYEEMLDKCNEIQDSIRLDAGPLVKLGLFKTATGDYFFIAIHSLLIDDRSWEILLEDLESGYAQAMNGEEITFGKKTASYKEWSEKLNEYADSHTITKQFAYWNELEEVNIKKLPRDAR